LAGCARAEKYTSHTSNAEKNSFFMEKSFIKTISPVTAGK
jgi:hypothetical protein